MPEMHPRDCRPGIGTVIGGACAWLLVIAQGHAVAAVGLSDLTGPWQLFVDDYTLASKVGVTRTYHPFQKYAGNPVMVADKAWEGANIYIYGTVLPNESGPGYRMWYHSLNLSVPSADRVHANYATSLDGITWTKPELGIISYNGSKANNIFIVPGNCPSVMHTPWEAGIGRTYKLMRGGPWGVFSGAYSLDALHWTEDSLARCPAASDECTFAWDAHAQKYRGFPKVFATVNGLSRRATGVWSASNFDDWPSGTNLILAPDSWDDRWTSPGMGQGTQFYGMCGFAYESMYVGFLWVFRVTGQVSGADDGPIFVEIVTSHDGIHWRREEGDRPPILPLGPDGAWDDGMVFTAIQPLVEGDILRLYYGGFNSTHADEAAWHAAIGMATLRKDGFASLDAGATTGMITTKRINGAGGPLHVNCSVAAGGWLKVEVLNANGVVVPGYSAADCNVIQGDHVDQVVTWGAQTVLPASVNPIRLRFLMQDASLYSFMPGDGVQFWAETTPTLAVLYDFEGETGQAAHDKLVTDGAQDPTLQGDVTINTDPAFAAFGTHSAAFGYGTSTPDMLTVPATSNLGVNFTLAAMVNSATGEYSRIFSTPSAAWGTATMGLALDFDPSGVVIPGLRLTCKGMEISSSPLSIGAGQYHHVAVTYNDGRVFLYLDGTSVGSGYVSRGDPVVLPGDLRVGADAAASAGVGFIGYIDDVLVTGRALSAAEIASLAQSGASAFFGVARTSSDFDRDGDVDLADFSVFQTCFNGPNRPPACEGTTGAPSSSATVRVAQMLDGVAVESSVISISFLENWDSYAAGYTDPAYVARWPAVLGTSRYKINTTCPSSLPNNLRAGSGDSCAISHNLVPDLQALLPGAVEVAGTDAIPLTLSYNACLQGSLQYADVIIELSKGEVHAPGTDSAEVLPVLAFGMAAAIHAPSVQPWFFDGQYWRSTNVLKTTVDPNVLTMSVRGNTVLLSGGAGSIVQSRAYRGGFDRITIRSQLNGVIGRLLDDIRLTGGQVIGACTVPPVVTSITPTVGRSDERVSMRIEGSGFRAGLTQVKLVKEGEADVVASQVVVAADEQSLTCALALDLYGATPGTWDVLVSTPSCPNVVVPGAFTVTPSTTDVAADLDHDGDVDLSDFAVFQACFNGPNRPPACQ